jgi:nicotinate dehydrogenase subunit A
VAAICVSINGVERELDAPPRARLLDLLRDTLRLKGTRFGCGSNRCGACHVLVDGRSIAACDTPLWAVQGREVVTVEGLVSTRGPAGARHDTGNGAALAWHRWGASLQQAFIDEQAAQCGYCSSGMLISAAALLREQPQPSEAEVRKALDGHLCRCGAHNRIVRAVLRAAEGGA